MTQDNPSNTKLHPKQREMVIKTATLLAGMGCKYYIKTPDGEVFAMGVNKISKAGDTPAARFKPGERTAYVRPYIEQIKEVGQIVSIPPGVGMTLSEVMAIASTTAHADIGKGMYQAEIDETNNCVTVMNTGGIRV